jgi:Ni/Co efflux regulator RcnB
MRKFLISLLLANAAAGPAIAVPNDSSDHQQTRAERQQARADRQAPRLPIAPQARGGQFQAPPQQFQAPPRQFNGGARFQPQPVAPRESFGAQPDPRFEQQRSVLRQQEARPAPNVMRNRGPMVVSDTPQRGTQPPMRVDAQRRLEQLNWNPNWQNNGQYDWRGYRNNHGSLFHLSVYIDPFSWGYQPYSTGWRMWPAYYGNQYWIDPAMYDLPFPPPGCAWVRYWNDAVLVDIYTGTVVDAIPGFFW